MSFNVSISNGLIGGGVNVIIPNNLAGIGDLVYKNGGEYRVYARGTVTNINVGWGTFYGAIFGEVAGMKYIIAPNSAEVTRIWMPEGMTCTIGNTIGVNTVLMRNGLKSPYYAVMNVARCIAVQSNYTGSAIHPTSAWTSGGLMNAATFAANSDAVALYGTYENYMKQLLRVPGAPNSPFGMTWDDTIYGFGKIKAYEYGRAMCSMVAQSAGENFAANYPAICYCYSYNEGNGTWWLPSMNGLGELMIDEHLDKVNSNNGVITVSASLHRWSCCRFSSGLAWAFNVHGISFNDHFQYGFLVRPVTLLKL